MTILPKKKAKEKQVALQQQPQPQDNEDTHDDDLPHPQGAAGGHSPPLVELEEDCPQGYSHYSSNYYDSHYSSEESSPELPVLSKVRYRGGSTQKKSDPALPRSPNYNGYNSGEEYDGSIVYFDTEKERLFEETLKQDRGFIIKRMRADGACLFRSVADQVYGDQEMHSVVRNNCMDYMLKNSEYFSQFVTEDFEHYINRKRSDRSYGNYLEMQAIAEMYNRCIEVYQYSTEPINIFFGVYKTDNAPIRLSYHGSVHYNSVVDPHSATIGVGLGLAGHKPGVADKNLLNKAKKESELVYLEQSMLEDKLLNSDWDATCEAVEQAVARESYLQWLGEQEKHTKGTVGESSRLPQSLSSHGVTNSVSLQPLPSSIPPSAVTTATMSLTTTTVLSKTSLKKSSLRARSRSRSSSRGQSPATVSPQTGRRSPKEGRGTSPKTYNRTSGSHSGSNSRRTSPLHSPHSSPDISPRASPLASRHASASPTFNGPIDNGRLPGSSPLPPPAVISSFPSSSHHLGCSRNLIPSSSPPTICGGTSHVTQLKSHDIKASSPLSSSPPTGSLDYESGKVLRQTPYEYSSFLNLPSSAFGLASWETEDDPELMAVLAASQQEYLDELKRSRGAESL